ncbi:peptidylprolyl isomerase [Dokdonella sp.]|uniref:peptidylprolyl isomerase n=1 Tax=Dokdonella sp. TaxID=2291710 RepID=UPI0025C591B4|nr:peptidylprolyl isomerase [Dokdonella sp.]MBX3690801.1 peptidylprolyl isomerase [Dokdonella sp.]
MIPTRNFPLARRIAVAAGVFAITTAVHADERLAGDTVVASRGGVSVTLADVDASLLRLPPGQRADLMNSPVRIEEKISELLLTRQLAAEAARAGLDKDPLVQHAIELSKESVLGTQAMLDYRAKLDLGDVAILAKEMFDANPAAYAIPEDVVVQHLLVDSQKRGDSEARALATSLLERAKKGEDFEALVLEYSDDPGKASNKGVYSGASSARMDPDFAAASGKLRETGEFAPLTKSQFGYHVIRLVERHEPKPRSWDEVSAGVTEDLRKRLTDARVKDYVDNLRGKDIDANPDAVASLRTRYLPAPEAPSKKAGER